MKQVLAILVVIGFVAALSNAANVLPVKDSFFRYDNGSACTPWVDPAYYGQQVFTYGGQSSQRGFKAYNQDKMVMEFDRTAILTAASTVLGRAATADDFASGAVVMTLKLRSVAATGFVHTAQGFPAYITSTTAWLSEGRASYDYVDGTDANNPIDVANTVQWNGGVNESALGKLSRSGNGPQGQNYSVRDCPTYYDNSVPATVWAADDNSYQSFVYPASTAAAFLGTSLNAYLLVVNDSTVDTNGQVFSKEATDAGAYAGPILNIALAPEPMTLSLLAAGGLALIRRRK